MCSACCTPYVILTADLSCLFQRKEKTLFGGVHGLPAGTAVFTGIVFQVADAGTGYKLLLLRINTREEEDANKISTRILFVKRSYLMDKVVVRSLPRKVVIRLTKKYQVC